MINQYEVVEVTAVEELEPFNDEYVYDLEMEDSEQPWFFANDILVHNSMIISLKPIIDKNNIPFTTQGVVSPEVYKEVEYIESYLNSSINRWAKDELKSIDPRFTFKRELIGDIGIFLQKKRYVLHMLDDEGVKCNKFKYTGVEVVRTTMPKVIKPYAKKIIETILMSKSMVETNKVVAECYDIFKGLSLTDISFVMGIKDYNKYASKSSGFTTVKGTPIHVKSAYYYNLLLSKLGISDNYEPVTSGDKVRFVYLQTPNKYGIESIGFKEFFPKEFETVFKPDYDKMFNKILFSMIERFYQNLDWTARKPSEKVQTELFDLFG